jgi:DNA-directed RNA polymerase specialized sigma24 family protein
MQVIYSELTNKKLIEILAQHPIDEHAWLEFHKRYHQFICSKIYKESIARDYREGCDYVEDHAQDVYQKLLKNDCQALKVFKCDYENSIFKYLEIIVIRTILNKQKESVAQKRPPEKEKKSLNEPLNSPDGNKDRYLEDRIESGDWGSIINVMILKEDIEYCLNKIFNNNHKKELYKLILKYHIFEGLDSRLIAESLDTKRSPKTISNIISITMPSLKTCLKKRLKEN